MALKRSERFKPIQNIAQQNEDLAAQTLGKIQRELSNHHLKLSELMKYYQDYTAHYNKQAKQGMSIIQAQSYQKFISQLEDAITEQKKHVGLVSEARDSSRANWTVERQKTQVLDKVITRYKKQEQVTYNRQEQKRSDEFVANRHWHKNKQT